MSLGVISYNLLLAGSIDLRVKKISGQICVLIFNSKCSFKFLMHLSVSSFFSYLCFMNLEFLMQEPYASYVKDFFIGSTGFKVETYNQNYLKNTTSGSSDRLWWFQVCSEVAYFQVAPANDSIRSSQVNTKFVLIASFFCLHSSRPTKILPLSFFFKGLLCWLKTEV